MATRVETRTFAAEPAELPAGTLVQLFFEAVDAHDKPDAFRHKVGDAWQSVSHARAESQVRHLTNALDALGVERGDRVGLLSENRPDWALADYACLCHGALDVPIYPTLPADQIAYILKDAGAVLVFVSSAEQLEKVQGIRSELPALRHVVVFDDVAVEDDAVLTLERAVELGRGTAEQEDADAAAFRERALQASPEDVATILYTSGTTGQPKGVMLTHNNIHSNVRSVSSLLDIGTEDVALSLLPLSHIFERMVDYVLFWRGVTIAYAESIERVPDNLMEVRPTIVASVPRLYEKIYTRVTSATGVKGRLVGWARRVGERWVDAKLAGREPSLGTRLQYGLADRLVFSKLRARTGGRLRFFVSGGAPLSGDIARFFYAAGILILEGYGLTETSPVTNVNTPDSFRFGTVGRPAPGTEIRIAEDGEILVRGPQVMKGYFNNEAATREVIDEDGWFRTGDVGEIDADGFLRITDRKKDIIVTAGGKNIAPQPIENRVKLDPFVTEAVMIGDQRPFPVLLVVPNLEAVQAWAAEQGKTGGDAEALLHDADVKAMLESRVFAAIEGLARFEMPKKVAFLAEEFKLEKGELTPTLKVRRRVVQQRYADLLEGLYSEAGRAAGA